MAGETRLRPIQLQVTEDFEVRARKWRENLSSLMKEKGLTQKELAKRLNDRFRREGVTSNFTQKNVSEWLRVGDSVGSSEDPHAGATVFPRYEVMIQIAAVLGVDVGHLTGETDYSTFDAEKASAYMGISEGSIESIRRIAKSAKSVFAYKYMEEGVFDASSVKALDTVLSSPRLRKLIATLTELERIYHHTHDTTEEYAHLVEEYGEDIVRKAAFCVDNLLPEHDFEDDPEEYEHMHAENDALLKKAGVKEDELDRVFLVMGLINLSIDKGYERTLSNYDWEVAYRNLAQQAFAELVDDAYPLTIGM